jgi:wyosine [tRNA(Phe)-imidazoG37] synthetase (radical SAM superfamily)
MSSYKYIYGPVNSWRLGRSLGIDPISSSEKICTFDCIYCQIGRTSPKGRQRKVFVKAEKIAEELKSLPAVGIDYITFSGTGEPTLAKNLGQMIKVVRSLRNEKIAVLTNATLLTRQYVRNALKRADLVEVKLDAPSDNILRIINAPYRGFSLKKIIRGIREFKKEYKGVLALQIMFTKNNIEYAQGIARIAKSIKPDEVHINTPLRPSLARPVSRAEIKEARRYFEGLNVLSVYDARNKIKARPISKKETMSRRGKC